MAGVDLSLRDRTVVVAGAGGGGIGTAVSEGVAHSGATVLGLDVDADALAITEQVVGETGGRFVGARADVTDVDAVEGALAALDVLPPLHGLVHVVGGIRYDDWMPVTETAPSRFAAVVERNLQTAFVTTHVVTRRLVGAGSPGSVVLISSISGTQAMPFGASYAAAKAGVLALVRTAALELGPHGVRVNAVAPGTVRTSPDAVDAPEEQDAVPLRRRGVPADVANAARFLLSDLAAYVTGHTLVVDGGSSVRPSYLDAADLPVFVHDAGLRARLLQPRDER